MLKLRNRLAQYLIRLSQLEVMTESIRESIAKNPYFQIKTVFERFDKFKKAYLIPSDIA
jgi:hypothetical protein